MSRSQAVPGPLKVLFVCIHNAGRSQMAEAFASRLGLEAYSCGSSPADVINPVAVEAMREKGLDISAGKPKGFAAVPRADVVVTMGCGDACPYLPGRRFDWNLSDPRGQDLEKVRTIRDEIERRVRDLRDLLAKESAAR